MSDINKDIKNTVSKNLEKTVSKNIDKFESNDIKGSLAKSPDKEKIKYVERKKIKDIYIDSRLIAGKLDVKDWLEDLPNAEVVSNIVEIRFKNTRKGFYENTEKLNLKKGDIVVVEANLGHDVGVVSLTGELVTEQMFIKKVDLKRNPLKKIYRKARPNDIEKWRSAISMEYEIMIKSRKIASDLQLNMKIGDVEFQGDKTKAIFYYIADERVDFRTLIKVLAETFHIRIEMKQIGARQEAGRIGGIGPCGRELCCGTFISNFVSVSTSSARYQDISLNPQKLAGQCGKLKCCLNYEVDAYIDAQKDFPSTNIELNTGEGILYYQKTDIFGRTMTYSFDKEGRGIFIQVPVNRVKEIIKLNRKGIIPTKINKEEDEPIKNISYNDGVGEESLNRFDNSDDNKSENKSKRKNKKLRIQLNKKNKNVTLNTEDEKKSKNVRSSNAKNKRRPNNKNKNKKIINRKRDSETKINNDNNLK